MPLFKSCFPLALIALLLAGPAVAQPVLPAGPQRQADSLRQLLARPGGPDSARLNRLLRLGRLVLPTDTAQASQLVTQALALARRQPAPLPQARALLLLGRVRQTAGAYEAAIRVFEVAAGLARQAHAPSLESRILSRHALALNALGRAPDALRLALQALSRAEAGPEPGAVAEAYDAQGRAQLRQRNYPAALAAFGQVLAVYEKLHDRKGQGGALNMLGIVSRDAQQRAASAAYLKRAVAAYRSLGDSTGVASVLVSLGVLEMRLFTKESAQRALVPLRRAERIYLSMGTQSPALLADLYSIMAANLSNSGRADLGLEYGRRGLRLARQAGDLQEVADALEGLGMLAYANDQYMEAYEFEHQAKLVGDTIQSGQAAAKMAEMQTRYEAEKRETRNRLQAAQLLAQRLLLRRREVQLWSGLAVGGLLLGLAYLLYNRRRLRREVEFAQERQRLDRQRTAAVLEAEEAERHRIGADLHDGVGQLLSVVKLNVDALSEELRPHLSTDQTQRFGDALDLVDESVREVRGISHNLLPNALIKRGLARAVREFLEKIQRPGRLRIRLETLGLDEPRLDPMVENTLYRVIQELVQNIVKHAQASELTLHIIRHEGELTLLVEDNGVGFDPAVPAAGAGIGLHSVASRVAYLGGTLHLDSRPGHGTTVTATVPVG